MANDEKELKRVQDEVEALQAEIKTATAERKKAQKTLDDKTIGTWRYKDGKWMLLEDDLLKAVVKQYTKDVSDGKDFSTTYDDVVDKVSLAFRHSSKHP
ncbi:hypothetical protein KCU92_g8132, partial [Aureobasidium melanogenum]